MLHGPRRTITSSLSDALRIYQRHQRAFLASSSSMIFPPNLCITERFPRGQKRFFLTDATRARPFDLCNSVRKVPFSFSRGLQNGWPDRREWSNVDAMIPRNNHIQEILRFFQAPHDTIPYDVKICIAKTENNSAQTFEAHKFILALFSDRFKRMWSGGLQRGTHDPEDAISFSDVDPNAFANMLRYMYTDDRSGMTMDNIMDSLFCARFFEVGRLTEICRDFTEIGLTAGNACHVFRRARLMGDERMAQLALSVICKSPDGAFASREFLLLFPSDLKAILNRDDLNMPESLIYNHVRRWALNRMCQEDGSDENLRDAFGDLKFAIRFPLFDRDALDSGPLKDGVITAQELDESASSEISRSLRAFQSTPRQAVPAPFYISCYIGCDAFGTDKDDWITGPIIIELRPEFAPYTCDYARRLVKLADTPTWCNIRLVACDGFFIDFSVDKKAPEPSESVSQETSILSRTVPGAVCFGWEGNHCIISRGPGFKPRGTGEPVYSIWLASEKPDGGAVFGRIVHGIELLKSAYGHFLAGDVTTSGIDYWTHWSLHDSFPTKLCSS